MISIEQMTLSFVSVDQHDIYRGFLIKALLLHLFHTAITFNDQHAGSNGNFSPDLPGTGAVDIYGCVTIPALMIKKLNII